MSDVILTPGPSAPQLVRPVWADPAYLLSLSEVKKTNLNINGVLPVRIALNNPRRWAIAFAYNSNGMADLASPPNVAPLSVGAGWALTSTGLFYRLIDHGPMVCEEWYISGVSGIAITVYESVNL